MFHMRSTVHSFSKTHHKHAFTLFEVSLSLALVAFGVIRVLMLFPAGLKAQQMARYQLIAATKAEEMIESFTATNSANPAIDTEGLMMWDVPSTHRSQAWDIEARLSSHRFGLMPVPIDIARRLDSDGDEIQNIIAQGGYVYYSQPQATTNLVEQGMAPAPPNEAQKLIIAIAGSAQQNCLHIFPGKNWPYHTPWPSPPLTMGHMADPFLPKRNYTKNPAGAPGSPSDPASFYNYYSWPWADMWQIKSVGGGNNDNEVFCVPWESGPNNTDPDMQKVYHWPIDSPSNDAAGYFPYACGINPHWERRNAELGLPPPPPPPPPGGPVINPPFNPYRWPVRLEPGKYGEYPSRKSVLNYVASTLWYIRKKGFPDSFYSNSGADPYAKFAGESIAPGTPNNNEANYWKEVQAMRFLAHAATCLTGWYSYKKSGNPDETEDLSTGVKIPIINLAGQASHTNINFKITHDLIRYYHERSLYLINTFSARYPYDWAMPRSLNRVTMMDFPIMQADLFSPPQPIDVDPLNQYIHYTRSKKGGDGNNNFTRIFGRDTANFPMQWRPVAPEPITHMGVSHTFPTRTFDPNMPTGNYGKYFGNLNHFNITAPFDAAERCREIVVWAVDWRAYEDCETAPSAPVDASKYPLAAPRGNWKDWGSEHGWTYPQTPAGEPNATPYTRDFNGRMSDVEFRDEQLWAFRNPEKVILFYPYNNEDPRTFATGADVSKHMILNFHDGQRGHADGFWNYPDQGSDKKKREVFNGLYGADRNFNMKLDRGPVPISTRMRAVSVARFNFYDPRVQAILR